MKRTVSALFGLVGLAACVAPEVPSLDPTVSARAVIIPIMLQTELPGIGAIPEPIAVKMADCIVDHATDTELNSLALAAVTGPNADTTYMVGNILKRPETTSCVSRALTAGGQGA